MLRVNNITHSAATFFSISFHKVHQLSAFGHSLGLLMQQQGEIEHHSSTHTQRCRKVLLTVVVDNYRSCGHFLVKIWYLGSFESSFLRNKKSSIVYLYFTIKNSALWWAVVTNVYDLKTNVHFTRKMNM